MSYKRRDDQLESEITLKGVTIRIYSCLKRTRLWYHVEKPDGTVYVSTDFERSLPMIDQLFRDIERAIT